MLKYKSTSGFVVFFALSVCVCLVRSRTLQHRADENIGALVQVHSSGDRSCESFDLHGLLTIEAVLYAIDEVNSGKHLDLEATLGYNIHETCPNVYESTRDLVLQARTIKQNTSFAAVLSSLRDENVESLLLLLTKQLPFVGCGSFSRRALNKHLDEASTNFKIFHAVPSDKTLIKAMVHLMTHFDWSVAAVYDDETISSSALEFLEEESTKRNGCIVKTLGVRVSKDSRQISQVIEELRLNLSVSVVLLLTTRNASVRIINEAAQQKAVNITWIMGKDSWDRKIDGNIAQKVVVLDSSATNLPGFKEHLENLHMKPIRNIWLREIVGDSYSKASSPTVSSSRGSQGLVCNDPLDAVCRINRTALKHVAAELVSIADEATCMVDVVFAVAHALAAKEKCSVSCSPRDPLYKQLREVDFSSPTGRRVSFSSDGFLKEVEYHISTYLTTGRSVPSARLVQEGSEKRRMIGTWKILTEDGTPQLMILPGYGDMSTGLNGVETRYCTGRCQYGQCKVYKKDSWRGGCCWQCRDCHDAAAQFAAKNNQTPVCPGEACPKHVTVNHLRWTETGTLVLLFLIAFGLCLCLYFSCVLLHNRDRPVMRRATNATLTLLPFILLVFLLPLPLLCKPSEVSCELYRALFLFALGVPLAALIAKAQLIQEAFYDCDGNVKGNWMCCSPRATVLFLVLVLHVIFVVVIRMLEPAQVLILPATDSASAFLECSVHSSVSFPIMVLYLLIGAGVVSIMSLRDVSVPGNDFEVKWVSLSMFLWYILAFLYVALMFSLQHKHKILALGFVDFLHALNLFACLYIPKWFVVVFRPERNCGDASPFKLYLKAQEKVSLRLSSQGDESPVLPKRGCRELIVNSKDSPAVKDTYV